MTDGKPQVSIPKNGSMTMGVLKLSVAMILSLMAVWFVSYYTSIHQRTLEENTSPTQGAVGHQIPGSIQDFEKAIEGVKGTNDLLINWTIVLLGGSIGIAILAQGAKIRDRKWGLIFIPPTWVFLAASLQNGTKFKSSLTFQLAKGQYIFRDLNLFLFLQLEFFMWSLAALGVLALWYLFFRFSLWED
jgi:hypothetical protein